MKRQRSIPSSSSPISTGTTRNCQISTPPTPNTIRTLHYNTALKPTSKSSKKPRRNILSDLESPESSLKNQTLQWVPLRIGKSELFLPLTFPTGQTFRWKQTGALQYTGVVGSHLVSLKQLEDGDVAYCFHCSPNFEDNKCRMLALMDFLNMKIRLKDIWEEFSASDSRFAELSTRLTGARVLRQDPLECLVQFLCSSNNNIGRITKMVDFISSLGNHLATVEGFEFYEFPTLERLSQVSEEELRKAGFGYRAKYIVGTVDKLQSKPDGGVEWLSSLRKLNLREAVDALCSLPGVGPKVAACIALFSLDHHQAIPVDTHVWKRRGTSFQSWLVHA
ncbi:N-glycosylase/DNA lyase OGG1 isoform X2 [Impatiens glandulifera]|uniref:N-glycosylase/DNA lyase OGG1 isoform X2 n=1 Tax=Impatiens glandulifera TaxID=253017 RepID=UPI001FB0BF06|nr:N-glycosylase/DNA lyase OGG1 isoform X2 [Impatiens glandulifera]